MSEHNANNKNIEVKNESGNQITRRDFFDSLIDGFFGRDLNRTFPDFGHMALGHLGDLKSRLIDYDLGIRGHDGITMKCSEEDNKFVTCLAVPGVKREEINVKVVGRVVKVAYHSDEEDTNGRFVRSGEFDYLLQEETDADRVEVSLADGVLTIVEPFREEAIAKERELEIK